MTREEYYHDRVGVRIKTVYIHSWLKFNIMNSFETVCAGPV